MSIISASRLSRSELAMLGNNLKPVPRKHSRELRAVNRSLAIYGESVRQLSAQAKWRAQWPQE